MRFFSDIVLAIGLATPVLTAWVPESTFKTDLIAGRALLHQTTALADGRLKKAFEAQGVSSSCKPSQIRIRRDYATLSNTEKREYIRAVKCLMDTPSRIPEGVAPGAKSRYDDFVAVHINQTQTIHFTGNFLSWHRNYIHAFESALRSECRFTGTLPYWNWAKSAQDPLGSPYMDGSPLSQGGNGDWVPHACTRPGTLDAPCLSPVVEGRGGGCVTTGPYAGYQANLSSVEVWFDYPNIVSGPWMGYQPRCIRRDIMPELTRQWAREPALLELFTDSSLGHLAEWQIALQGQNQQHGIGHFTYGGDPGGDIYASPNDPMFWLHHGGIDRTWWMWQNQNRAAVTERLFQIGGTRTKFNDPPSDPTTLDDVLDMGYVTPLQPLDGAAGPAAAKNQIRHHVSTVAGPYCYVYL
ncbi:tyrosinase [Microdochium nivale]|nr:tyrosinase [Microdochium nivale]